MENSTERSTEGSVSSDSMTSEDRTQNISEYPVFHLPGYKVQAVHLRQPSLQTYFKYVQRQPLKRKLLLLRRLSGELPYRPRRSYQPPHSKTSLFPKHRFHPWVAYP